MSIETVQAAAGAPKTFEFTKRKRWADLLVTDLADGINLIISETFTILYCAPSFTEITGWKNADILECDFLQLLSTTEDHTTFHDCVEESMHSRCKVHAYIHINCSSEKQLSYPFTPKNMLFEVHGEPRSADIEGVFFFLTAKPFPCRNADSLGTFADIKSDNDNLQRRHRGISNQLPQKTVASPLTVAPIQIYATSPIVPLTPNTSQTGTNLSSSSLVPSSSSPNQFDTLLGSAFDSGLFTVATGPGVTAVSSLGEEENEDLSRRKKPSANIAFQAEEGDNWRAGPLGPKTLCNACGLRWAKQSRTGKVEDPATSDNSNLQYDLPPLHLMPSMQIAAVGVLITLHSSMRTDQLTSGLAVSLNSNDVQIYSRQDSEWVSTETLSEHDKLITSIDWAPRSNRIVTASQDRNAYVWQEIADPETGKLMWKPTLVLLRINRAATHVRWSPNEDKFAVASGARAIAICSFDEENNWWVSKLLKKPIRSTVLSVDWHPNNVLLAAGSADMKARVFSAFIKEVDEKPAATVWGSKLPFNTVCGEYSSPAGGWVHAVAFSPSGDVLAFASHDSSVNIVYPTGPTIINVKISSLPFVTLAWTGENVLVAAGHDCQPVVFSGSDGGWQSVGSLDAATGSKASDGGRGIGYGGNSSVGRLKTGAFAAFRDADSRGQPSSPGSASASTDTQLLTIHQNTITSIRSYEGYPGQVSKVSTTGVDGKLVIWDVNAVDGR
ncbi:hypothetical protein H0H93_011718 [Arthromyces matolae]|nr:hypothetical protein H0H93_011718 [Arthromyces matolae]